MTEDADRTAPPRRAPSVLWTDGFGVFATRCLQVGIVLAPAAAVVWAPCS